MKQFSSQATGLDLSDLNGGAKEYLWRQIGTYPEAQELFLDFAAFTTVEIISLMSMAALQKLVFQAALSSMMKGAFSAFTILNMDKIMAFQIGLGVAAGVAFIVDVAVKTKKRRKSRRNRRFRRNLRNQRKVMLLSFSACSFVMETQAVFR